MPSLTKILTLFMCQFLIEIQLFQVHVEDHLFFFFLRKTHTQTKERKKGFKIKAQYNSTQKS